MVLENGIEQSSFYLSSSDIVCSSITLVGGKKISLPNQNHPIMSPSLTTVLGPAVTLTIRVYIKYSRLTANAVFEECSDFMPQYQMNHIGYYMRFVHFKYSYSEPVSKQNSFPSFMLSKHRVSYNIYNTACNKVSYRKLHYCFSFFFLN